MQDPPPAKRARTSVQGSIEEMSQEADKNVVSTAVADPLQNWVLNERWPVEYFEPDGRTREELFERDSSSEETIAQHPIPVVRCVEINGFRYPMPVKKTPTSLGREQSDASLSESGNYKRRESKSTPYRNSRYPLLLAAKGSYMENSTVGITAASLKSCNELLALDQTVPSDSMFRDDVFEETCDRVQNRNEARVIRSISPYILPSAEDLAIIGAAKLKCLIENVNEAWIGSIPVEGPRPQPDYSVGFKRSAFTEEQLGKLDPLLGTVFDTSFFIATYRMYFPFFAGEVKCGASALDIADRQNAHSMTLAVRGVVELYNAVGRKKELDREILAFSVSHDHRSVRIYGHYPVLVGDSVTYYRHPIHAFGFTALNGREKWTAYKFVKNVYEVWMPIHLERICSAIDQLPSSLNFEVPQMSELQPESATGLSQDMDSLLSELPDAGTASQIGQGDDASTAHVLETATPDSSVSQGRGHGWAKRARKD